MATSAQKDNISRLKQPIRGRDGNTLREVLVPKGTTVWLGNYMCGTAKDVWGDTALEWRPERWQSSLPAAVTEANFPGVYSNLYATFPRSYFNATDQQVQDDFRQWRKILPGASLCSLRNQ